MIEVKASGKILGATIEGLDLSQPLSAADFALTVRSLGAFGVLRFPGQALNPAALKAFSARFGTLEVNVAAAFYEPGMPEVMILSNIIEQGRPIGLADAGQDWHTDMSYSRTIAFANVLYGIHVPRRQGRALGNTEFLNMHAAYEDLPDEIKVRLRHATAVHDFNKFWEMMRRDKGSNRPPLTAEQRRKKPPVSQPVFLRHPVTNRFVLYANPGYTVRIEGIPERESDELLDFLFRHQVQDQYRYAHEWSEHDVLMWDNLGTVHRAIGDYGPDEPRLMKRCQVMADRVFDANFMSAPSSVETAA